MTPRSGQRGAALISAMITVTLVASLASAALWQQWRHVEIESAERSRAQTAWLLTGALDFSRLVLREDKGPADHLAEPWALGLQESKLSSFLAQDKQVREGDPEVYLSGGMTDAQSRLNVRNLIDNALRYSADGAEVRIVVQPAGQQVLLQVEDSGPGMTEADRQRLGERFFRVLGSSQGGSGLGWSIVRRIAEAHRATIALTRSAALGGLAVRLLWPGMAEAEDCQP